MNSGVEGLQHPYFAADEARAEHSFHLVKTENFTGYKLNGS